MTSVLSDMSKSERVAPWASNTCRDSIVSGSLSVTWHQTTATTVKLVLTGSPVHAHPFLYKSGEKTSLCNNIHIQNRHKNGLQSEYLQRRSFSITLKNSVKAQNQKFFKKIQQQFTKTGDVNSQKQIFLNFSLRVLC